MSLVGRDCLCRPLVAGAGGREQSMGIIDKEKKPEQFCSDGQEWPTNM